MSAVSNASHLTVRGVSAEVARALRAEAKKRGKSLNQTVVDLLRESLALAPQGSQTNGLEALAGNWSEAEMREFETESRTFSTVDDELWR